MGAELARLGFGETVPELDQALLEQGQKEIEADFKELMTFLYAEVKKNFEVLFVSSLGLADDRRSNLSELLTAVLPRLLMKIRGIFVDFYGY